MECDVVVVGAGLAGLVCANRAAELGRRVVVLEQGTGEAYPCNTRIATGVFNMAHADPELPPERLIEAIHADTEGHADPALAATIATIAGRGLAWLRAEGATFMRREVQDKRTWMLTPPRSFKPGLDWQDRGPDMLLRRLAENLAARGGKLITDTRARRLLMRNGVCHGVEAETGGAPDRFMALATVLADGGFQGNRDMVRRFIAARPDALVQRSAGSGCGDAIVMAADAGAKLVDMDRFYGHLLSRDALGNDGLWPYPTLDSLTGGSMLVDRSGRRFVDEGLGGILLSNILARLDDPLSATVIFDDVIWNEAGRDEPVPPNPTLAGAGGTLHVAIELAELAVRIGVLAGNLEQSVRIYNDAIRTGRLDRLDPPRTAGRRFGTSRGGADRVAPRPIERPPFYAAPVAVGISCTMGGIAVDPRARVMTDGGGPIPGLFAAGSTTGGIEGGPIAGYIGGLAKAYCLGLIAAETVAEVVR